MKIIITEQQNISLRRRLLQIKNLLDITLKNSHPCDFTSESHFFNGVVDDLNAILIMVNIATLKPDEIIDYVKEYMKDDIIRYYIDSQEDC
jgi:Holliday junction resolvasome RuvABC endonuclease subunit